MARFFHILIFLGLVFLASCSSTQQDPIVEDNQISMAGLDEDELFDVPIVEISDDTNPPDQLDSQDFITDLDEEAQIEVSSPDDFPLDPDEILQQADTQLELLDPNFTNIDDEYFYLLTNKENLFVFIGANIQNQMSNQVPNNTIAQLDPNTVEIGTETDSYNNSIMMLTLFKNEDPIRYQETFFPNYEKIARNQLITEQHIPWEIFREFAATYLEADFVVTRAVFDVKEGLYAYDILYLKKLPDSQALDYWFRSYHDETIPLQESLSRQNITNLYSYYIDTLDLPAQPAEILDQELDDEIQAELETATLEDNNQTEPESESEPESEPVASDEQNTTSIALLNEIVFPIEDIISTENIDVEATTAEEISIEENVETTIIGNTEALKSVFGYTYPVLPTTSQLLAAGITEEALYELYKKQFSYRTTHKLGTWINIETGDLVEILELTTESVSEPETKLYGAFTVTTPPVQPLTNDLLWQIGDLKLIIVHNKMSSSYYLDEEKMVHGAMIFFDPGKNMMIVSLANSQEQMYYAPYQREINSEFYQTLKKSTQPSHNNTIDYVYQVSSSDSINTAQEETTMDIMIWPISVIGVITALILSLLLL